MKLMHFLQNFPDDAQPAVHNQDLVGFFTSIPVERILSAIQWLINGYAMTAMKRKADISTALFSVDLKEKDTKLRIWKGRQRKSAKRIHTICLRDVVGICKLSCEVSMFTVMGGTFRQTRGAAIGNQISPRLANATVAVREQQFANSIHHLFGQFSNSFWCIRYVDNRLVVLDASHENHPDVRRFLADEFYEKPVELETVHTPDATQEFLGFDLVMQSYRQVMLLREVPWKIRLPASAGAQQHKLAAYLSKRHSFKGLVFPESAQHSQLLQLQEMFIRAEYQAQDLPLCCQRF